jgi:ABC-type uncharacterized transport system involved in gliding motility auxiliary subunit
MGAQFATLSSVRAQFKPTGTRHVLAARLQGTFRTAFPNGAPAAEGGATNAAANRLVSGDSVVIVFADTDFLADENCVRNESIGFGLSSMRLIDDNLPLFANAVEQLAGRDELIGIRSRGSFQRPFAVVDDIEYRAMLQWQKQAEDLAKEEEEARNQIQELQKQKQGSQKQLFSREQQDAYDRFRARELEVKHELRAVNKNLRSDIETLGVWVKAVNIAAVPLLVIVFGVVRHNLRRRRS